MHTRSDSSSRKWLERLAWLGAFWIAGVTGMGLAAWLLRVVMRAAGLSL